MRRLVPALLAVLLTFVGINFLPRAEASFPCAQEIEQECELVREKLCKLPGLCPM